MATLDVRKILGPKDPSATRQVTLSKSWCDYHKLKPGTSVYVLTDGPFTVVVPGHINIEKAKAALEELVRSFNGSPRPITVRPKAPPKAPQGDDNKGQEIDAGCQEQSPAAAPAQPEEKK